MISLPWSRRSHDACQRHRPALVDWIACRADGPASRAAFGHLERCHSCEVALAEIAQTVIALSRLGAQAALIQPDPDGWGRLRDRLDRAGGRTQRPAERRWTVFGSLLAPALVAVLAMRLAVLPDPAPAVDAWPAGTQTTSATSVQSAVTAVPRPLYDTASRPLYDTAARPLTEGIVLVLAGRDARSARRPVPPFGPPSTDRRDAPRASRRPAAATDPSLITSRTAIRS